MPNFPMQAPRNLGTALNPIAFLIAVLTAGPGLLITGITNTLAPAIIGIAIAVGVLLSLKMTRSWQRAVVLRAGKVRGLRGPGLFFIVPVIDQIFTVVDQRIRSVPVRTRQTLTRDTTPVDVDAVVFWMVHDPLHAVTELDDYEESVCLVALTTLREVVSSSDLSVLLEERRRIDDELRDLIEVKTREWGVTVQSVEIRDVQLPDSLQDAMSRQAQAERERSARVTLANAERQVAIELAEAAKTYERSPIALQILQINRVFEMNKNRGTTILMPTSMADSMNAATAFSILQAGAPGQPAEKDQNSET